MLNRPGDAVRGDRDWAAGLAAGAEGVVTQNPRVRGISRVGISPFSASGYGDGRKFCDANRLIARTSKGAGQPRDWEAVKEIPRLGDAGLGWNMHTSDSRLASRREEFRFSDL